MCCLRLVHPRGWVTHIYLGDFKEASMRSVRSLGVTSVVVILLLAISAAAGVGQRVYGTIAATATAASGAAVAEANVTLTNFDNGEKHSMTTDTSGNYTFVNIQPGRY